MAEYMLPLSAPKARSVTRSSAIPLWEKGFAVLGLFLCLDAGIRTLRILSGTEGPIQNTATSVNYTEGSALTQILLFAVYLVSVMLLAMHPPRLLARAFKPTLLWCIPLLAMTSLLWSDAPAISFRRAVALLGSSIFGFYLATQYSRTTLLRLLLAVSVIAIVLSFLVGILLPTYAIDETRAWQGVFGQKNQLGHFMALSAALWLVYTASCKQHRLLICFGALSVVLLLLSHSATAIVLIVTMIAVLALVRLWRLQYRIALPILMVVVVIGGYIAVGVASNPSGVTTLLGRNAGLTGRTQLWSLVWHMIRARFGFGYGYGGFWLGFQGPSAPVWRATGWNPPNAHSGYLDLMLDLGVVGLIIFVLVIVVALRYAFALARRGKTLDAAFPLIFLIFFLVSNVTESYLVAYNSLSWVLFVAVTIHLHAWWQEERRPHAYAVARTRAISRSVRTAQELRSSMAKSGGAGFSLLDDWQAEACSTRHNSFNCVTPTAVEKDRNARQEGCRMPTQVTVSAIMPTYNAMPYLKEAIESVLAQTFTDWELIIVDDGSTDETSALLAQYEDPRIRVFELGENHGRAHARNVALGFACGKYIAPCDADDISLPKRFEKEVAYLESHREIHVVASQMMDFQRNESPQPRTLYPEDPAAIQRRFARGRMAVPFGAAMIRSWCFDRFGPMCEELHMAEDLEWFLRIRRSCNFRVLPEFLYLYRYDAKRFTFKKWIANARNDRYAVYRAAMFGAPSDRAVLSFDRFSRRWRTRLGLYTWDVLRFVNFRLRSNGARRRLK